MTHGRPYQATNWPAGADKAHYLALAAKGYPAASAETVERIAQAAAILDRGTKHFVAERSSSFDGEIVSPSTAAEIRQLGMKRAA